MMRVSTSSSAIWQIGIALIGLVVVSPALGYVQTRARGNREVARWRIPEVELTWSPSDIPKGISVASVRKALHFASAAWDRRSVGCTSMKVSVTERKQSLDGGMQDGVNSVVFHDRRFCKNGVDRPGYCYDRRMAAITSLYFDPEKRFITEADIEVNAVDFDFGERSGPTRVRIDLRRLLLHEVGHVLGFDHPCTRRPKRWITDHRGRAVPVCRSAPSTVLRSVMTPYADEIGDDNKQLKRQPRYVLSRFDRTGLCTVYGR